MTNPFDRFEADRNRDDSRVDEGRDTTAGTAQDSTPNPSAGDAGYVDYRDVYGSGQQQGYAPAQDFGPAPQQQDYPAQDYPQDYSAPGPAPQQDGLTKHIVPIIAGACALTAAIGLWFGMKGDDDTSVRGSADRDSSGGLINPKGTNIPVPSVAYGKSILGEDGRYYYPLPDAPSAIGGDLSRVDWGHPRLEVMEKDGGSVSFAADLERCDSVRSVTPSFLRCVYSKGHAILVYTVVD